MPVIVDSAKRRAEVVSQAVELILGGGLGALTFRNLASALGCSTTVVSHYFRDKDDVLLETYRRAIAQSMERRDRALAESGGSWTAALEEILPLGEQQRRHWMVWLCFWSSALFVPELHDTHRSGLMGTRERLRDHLLSEGHGEGVDEATQSICSALYGVAVQALFDPAYWTEGRQRATFRRAVAASLA